MAGNVEKVAFGADSLLNSADEVGTGGLRVQGAPAAGDHSCYAAAGKSSARGPGLSKGCAPGAF